MSATGANRKLIGVILALVGLALIYWGYQMSGSLSSQVNETFTGSPSDGVTFRYIAGAVSLLAGAFMLLKK